METPWTSKWYDETQPHREPRWTEVALWADSVEERLKKLEEKRVLDMAQERSDAASKKMVEEAGFHAIRDIYYREALESAAKMLEEWGLELASTVRGAAIVDASWAVKKHKVQP